MHKIWKENSAHPESENDKGDTIISRKGIANVFCEFYSKLFLPKISLEKKYKTLKTWKQE